MSILRSTFALALIAALAACGGSSNESGPEAVQRVLAEDSRLGTARNHACETRPIGEVVREYAAAVKAIDFAGTSGEFRNAFLRHALAWEDSAPFFDGFAELRGEMHDVFEEIRARGGEARRRLEVHEVAIWGTWAEVEAAAGTGTPGE